MTIRGMVMAGETTHQEDMPANVIAIHDYSWPTTPTGFDFPVGIITSGQNGNYNSQFESGASAVLRGENTFSSDNDPYIVYRIGIVKNDGSAYTGSGIVRVWILGRGSYCLNWKIRLRNGASGALIRDDSSYGTKYDGCSGTTDHKWLDTLGVARAYSVPVDFSAIGYIDLTAAELTQSVLQIENGNTGGSFTSPLLGVFYQVLTPSLSLTTPPRNTVGGHTLHPVVVNCGDSGDSTRTVTASWVSTSGSVALSGTVTVTMVAGVATFNGLVLTGTGTGHLHFAASSIYDPVDSATLTVDVIVVADIARTIDTASSGTGVSVSSPARQVFANTTLLVFVGSQNAGGTLAVSDTGGNTYVPVDAVYGANANKGRLYICANAAAHAANVVTLAVGGSSTGYSHITVAQIEGAYLITPLISGAHDVTGSASATASIASSIALPIAEEALVLSAFEIDAGGTGTLTPSAGFTMSQFPSPNGYFGLMWKRANSNTTPSVTMSVSYGVGVFASIALRAAPAVTTNHFLQLLEGDSMIPRDIRLNEPSSYLRTIVMRVLNMDGSPKTGLTGAYPLVATNGGTAVALTSTYTIQYMDDGFYYVILPIAKVSTGTVDVGWQLITFVPNDPGNYFCIPAVSTILPSGAYAETIDGSTLATLANQTSAATAASTNAASAHSDAVAVSNLITATDTLKQIAERVLYTFGGLYGHRIIKDAGTSHLKITDTGGTTPVSNEPYTNDTNGNIATLG